MKREKKKKRKEREIRTTLALSTTHTPYPPIGDKSPNLEATPDKCRKGKKNKKTPKSQPNIHTK